MAARSLQACHVQNRPTKGGVMPGCIAGNPKCIDCTRSDEVGKQASTR